MALYLKYFFTFKITQVRLPRILIDFFCLTDHGWVAVAKSLPHGQGKLLCYSLCKMSKNWVFIAGTDYRCRIPDILVQISAYYEALLRHEVTCCFCCNNFHPTAFCLPADFSAATVNVFFSLMDRPFHMISPYDDLVQFVRLCGFLLVSEAFLFHHLASPVVNGYLPCAILPLIWECYQNGFFRLHLTFSLPLMVVIFLGKFSILLKAIVLSSVIFIIIVAPWGFDRRFDAGNTVSLS